MKLFWNRLKGTGIMGAHGRLFYIHAQLLINPAAAEFVDMLHTFLSFINRSNRIRQCYATLIDDMWSNNLCHDNRCFQSIRVTDVSEYFLIFYVNYRLIAQVLDKYIVSWNCSYKNKNSFQWAIAGNDCVICTVTQKHRTHFSCFAQHFPKR